MTTEEYWIDAALKREIAVQEGAAVSAKEILRLYEAALDDIDKEIRTIRKNFTKRFGIDSDTAGRHIVRNMEERNLSRLISALNAAESNEARRSILSWINSDGLSARAYTAREERYRAVGAAIEARMAELYAAESKALGDCLRDAYKESYYGAMQDAAKGFDGGVNFAILNDKAVDDVLRTPWQGARFSERVWNNTQKLADEARELAAKSLLTGESLQKTSAKLAMRFEVAEYRSETLLRTEVAHAHNLADMAVYTELGIKEYKFLATLDSRTCSRCQPLDGQVLLLDDAVEGVNYPVMHPRCRCTTTINVRYGERSARDPVTGVSGYVDGDLTYKQWYAGLSDEQKAALELARKKDSRRTADKAQYMKYQAVLGKENVPKSFDKWQEMKYNSDKSEYERLKRWYKYEKRPYLQEQVPYTTIDGLQMFLPKGALFNTTRTIAGRGSKTEIRDIERVANTYGGDKGSWRKRVGKIEGFKHIFDVHWYELDGKQYELKVKECIKRK